MNTSTGLSDPLRDAIEDALEVSDTYIRVVDLETESDVLTIGEADEILNRSMADADSMGEFFETAIHPDDVASVESAYQRLVTGETTQTRVEYRTHPDNGPIQWVETYSRLNHTEDSRQLVTISPHARENQLAVKVTNYGSGNRTMYDVPTISSIFRLQKIATDHHTQIYYPLLISIMYVRPRQSDISKSS